METKINKIFDEINNNNKTHLEAIKKMIDVVNNTVVNKTYAIRRGRNQNGNCEYHIKFSDYSQDVYKMEDGSIDHRRYDIYVAFMTDMTSNTFVIGNSDFGNNNYEITCELFSETNKIEVKATKKIDRYVFQNKEVSLYFMLMLKKLIEIIDAYVSQLQSKYGQEQVHHELEMLVKLKKFGETVMSDKMLSELFQK